MKKEIVKKIEDIMTTGNLSQEDLSRKLKVDAATVSRWATGKTRPQKRHLQQLEKLENETIYFERLG